MKRKLFLLISFLSLWSIVNAMPYEEARSRAWFLTDKMAYELNLTPMQYDYVYEINLEYFLCIEHPRDCRGKYWNFRDFDLRNVLYEWQYQLYTSIAYFYHPIKWVKNAWHLSILQHYRPNLFYFGRPTGFHSFVGRGWKHRNHMHQSPYKKKPLNYGKGMREDYKNSHPKQQHKKEVQQKPTGQRTPNQTNRPQQEARQQRQSNNSQIQNNSGNKNRYSGTTGRGTSSKKVNTPAERRKTTSGRNFGR